MCSVNMNNGKKKNKSFFVTVLSVSFILIGLGGSLSAGLNSLALFLFLPEITGGYTGGESHPWASFFPLFPLIINHLRIIMLVYLGAALAVLISSIGLYLRKNWARKFFIFLLFLAVGWNILEIFLFNFISSFLGKLHNIPEGINISPFILPIRIALVFLGIVFIFFYLWIIRKLSSPRIKGEFAGQ